MLKQATLSAAFLSLCVGCGQSMEDLGGKSNPGMDSGDNKFFQKIYVANETEIESSQLALSQSQSPAVKQFAQKMIDDHTQAANKLTALAASKQITLPQHLDTTHQMMVDNLKDKSGSDFDSGYEKLQVAGHEEAITADSDEAENGSDSQTKAFANELLGTLKMHLDMAKQLQSTANPECNGLWPCSCLDEIRQTLLYCLLAFHYGKEQRSCRPPFISIRIIMQAKLTAEFSVGFWNILAALFIRASMTRAIPSAMSRVFAKTFCIC